MSRRRWPGSAALGELAASWSPRSASGGQPLGPLAVLLVLTAVDDLDTVAFGVLLPDIRRHFGLDLQGVLTVQAAAAPAMVLAGLGAGWLADRVSRTRLAAAGAVVWAGFTLLTGLAGTVVMLALARAGAGIGKAVNAPAHQSLLADYYPVGNRARMFSLHSLAGSLDAWIGPLAVGFIAAAASWRAPFYVFALVSLGAAAAAWLLSEPRRGGFERLALGVADDGAPEPPPSLAESWRAATGVRTLRRIWIALPLLVGGAAGISSLLSLYLEEVFGLGPQERGMVFFVSGAAGVAGLFVGAHLADRHLVARPQRALELVGMLSAASAASFALIAVVPNLALYIALDAARAFASAVLAPGLFAVMSLVIPPRVRGFALAAGAVFVLPGLLLLPVVGAIGDLYGLRASVLALVPVYLAGSVIVGSAGAQVGPDMRSAFAAAAARLQARRQRGEGGAPLLVARGLEAGHGVTQVLFGVDLELADGEIVALTGANGAGKSTLLRCLAGLDLPSGGAVVFDGLDTTFVPAEELAARGVVYAPGGRGVIAELTVEEHLGLAAWSRDDDAVAEDRRFALAAFGELAQRLGVPAGRLSAGEQQFLTLAQAALARPRLLLIDELTIGVAPAAVERVVGFVRALRDRGATVLFVEQSAQVVGSLATRVVRMHRGAIVDGRPLAARARPALRRPPGPSGRACLVGQELTVRHGGITALDAVDVEVAPGEILAVAGANGSGKTTLLDALSGAARLDRGRVLLGGAELTSLPAHRRAQLGLRRVFADARLFASLTVAEAVAVAGGERGVRRLLERVGAEDLAELCCAELSTGQRRLANLAVALAGRPSAVLLDEPSAGLTESDASRLGAVVLAARDQLGCALVVVEHDLGLLAAVADRALRLELGRVAAAGAPAEVLNPTPDPVWH